MELEDLQEFPPELEHPKPISSQNIPLYKKKNIKESVVEPNKLIISSSPTPK